MSKVLERGFSLFEGLIALAVSSVVGVILITVFFQNSGLFSQQSARINQGLTINKAAAQIAESIKQAFSIVSSNPIGSPVFSTGQNAIVLAVPSVDSSGNVIPNVFDYFAIAKDNQNPKILRKYVFGDPQSSRINENRVLATSLSQITFLYYDDSNTIVSPTSATKVNFIINLDEKAGVSNQQSSSSAEINLRNN